ncbi:MAG: hypothetical protein KBD63_04655 [Bacteriovoracaceae bacterium]|nr:hypothetical protein [Bacteriovoracaceae bacterium]
MNKNLWRIEVYSHDSKARSPFIEKIQKHFHFLLEDLQVVPLYLLKTEETVTEAQVGAWVQEVFCDSILQKGVFKEEILNEKINPTWVVEIRFRPGVTDNLGHAASEALSLVNQAQTVKVFSGTLFFLQGNIQRDQVQKLAEELFSNPLLQTAQIETYVDFCRKKRFEVEEVPEVHITGEGKVEVYNLDKLDEDLLQLSQKNCWALSLDELKLVASFYKTNENFRQKRKQFGLSENPTDVEMEIIAQSWSEHCKHKIFASEVEYSEDQEGTFKKLGPQKIKSLYKTYIKGATEKVKKERNISWLISVFSDNAGIVRFDKNLDVCVKVETHNSPSALDPYGGALTGILGVNRDILGCGFGAKPIANTDVFCFAPPEVDLPLPLGLKTPRRIMEGVHAGVEDGGNKSGIPTVNGAFFFDADFAGKPLVYVGTVGVLPHTLPSGIMSSDKHQKAGDLIVVAGGRVGKDGIHGATFSSMELTQGAPATVVQIGDPITQKRLLDFTLEARDLNLFSSITDNGAGGISSSIGEMCVKAGGASLDLIHVPVKYQGLTPYELMISESQERMSYAVPKDKIDAFLTLAGNRGVEVCVLGNFENTGELKVFYNKKIVALLDLHFLHEALPALELKAHFTADKQKTSFFTEPKKEWQENTLELALLHLLKRPNITSKEKWVRRYDHEVQAATVGKPFVGKKADGPADAGVVWLHPHGGEEWNGVTVSCGLAPLLSHEDTYLMSQYAVDEAVRNSICVGGDPSHMALVDNFCWPDPILSAKNPDGHHKMAQLVRSCVGLYDMATSYGMPFVSGKDSMKNDFIGKNKQGVEVKISVPPTLLVTAVAQIPDVRKKVTTDFKKAGDLIYLLGNIPEDFFTPSEFSRMFHVPNIKLPSPDLQKNLELYKNIFLSIQKGLIASCHDISEGGAVVALSEKMIAGRFGAKVTLQSKNISATFFNEVTGCFLVSVDPKNKLDFETQFTSFATLWGTVTEDETLCVENLGVKVCETKLPALVTAWKEGF